ncbi:hypothetical protein GCM10020295_19640 [Streptomyces cinereospinus]
MPGGRRLPGGVDGGVDHDVGAALRRERPAARGVVAGDHGADAAALQYGDHREAHRSAAQDDRDVLAGHLTPVDGVPGHGHGFGERGGVRGQAVGHRKGQCLLDDDVFGVAARGVRGETDAVDLPGRVVPGAR